MSFGLNKTSGLKICYIDGKNPEINSNTDIKFKYDANQIPVDFGVTSSDNINFNFQSGYSYFLMASVYWVSLYRTRYTYFSFSFYNNDTSSYIGTPGAVSVAPNHSTDAFSPKHSNYANLVLLNNNIQNEGINLSIRFKEINAYSSSSTYSTNYLNTSYNTGLFESQNIFENKPMSVKPVLTLIRTDS